MTTIDKKQTIAILKNSLINKTELMFSFLHGSFLDSAYFHDIDIAVYVDETMVPKEKTMDYEFDLSDELEDVVKRHVDVKVMNYAPLAFQYHATAGKILTCSDEELMADKVADIRIFYLDFKPTSRQTVMEMLGV
ncbi:MAG: nucleotidyltransferase domain-containing protein [Deltaproteobacteria bacterium]|nr:nucleotidyltransferase domain-containing protein [Deltaproteobacteria bacterium]